MNIHDPVVWNVLANNLLAEFYLGPLATADKRRLHFASQVHFILKFSISGTMVIRTFLLFLVLHVLGRAQGKGQGRWGDTGLFWRESYSFSGQDLKVGVNVPASVPSPTSDSNKPDGYLIMNIDFNATYYLVGFEFYTVKAGTVTTLVSLRGYSSRVK